MQDRVSIRNSGIVQCAIVFTGAPITAGLLRDRLQWGRPSTGGRVNNAQLQHVVELLTGNLEAFGGKPTGTCGDWRTSCRDVVRDVMFHGFIGSVWLCNHGEVREDGRLRPLGKEE